MALGGGTFMTQNKVLPGAYINFVSRPRAMGSLGERGVVCVGMELDWGREGMTDISAAEGRTNCRELFGYTYLSEEMKDLRELFAHAKEVKLYRLNGGEKARMTQDGLTVTAKYPGKRGNDICIKIAENVDESDCWDVETYLDAEVVDVQTVTRIEDLRENAFVEFGGTGGLTAAAGIYLTYTTAAATGSAYTAFSGGGREGGPQCTGIQRRGRENKKAVCEFYEANARGGRRKICDGAA